MSYFLLSSVHEYLMNTLSGERILEVKRVYKKSHNETLETYFDTMDGDNGWQRIEIPARNFFTDYYSRHKLSIHFLYAVRDRRFAARVLLSRNYLKSLNLKHEVNAKYVQCLCIPQFQPKSEDYVRLNRFFHSFSWKSPLEQQMLIACKIGNTVYEDFQKIAQSIQVIDTNANIFKTEVLSAIQNLDVAAILELSQKLPLLNRSVDIYNLQLLILLGFYLWFYIDHEFTEIAYSTINKFIRKQDIVYPHGILHPETKDEISLTLQVVFETQKDKLFKSVHH